MTPVSQRSMFAFASTREIEGTLMMICSTSSNPLSTVSSSKYYLAFFISRNRIKITQATSRSVSVSVSNMFT